MDLNCDSIADSQGGSLCLPTVFFRQWPQILVTCLCSGGAAKIHTEKRATSGRHINRRRALGWERTLDAVRSPSVTRNERRAEIGPPVPRWTRGLPCRAEPGPRVSLGSRLDRRERMRRPRRFQNPGERDWGCRASPGGGTVRRLALGSADAIGGA
ncbi:hypothetical protein NDU88_001521 [Pleurodeles waltl]|uniref:Uncharacterized protein n=1 Tax=Pleurodeles waltl TaxID=8319 RepID=A0AAV7RCV6_PLEWA|nr:hypothetical protein NDU88_001521 [Pleurodeles waltl]